MYEVYPPCELLIFKHLWRLWVEHELVDFFYEVIMPFVYCRVCSLNISSAVTILLVVRLSLWLCVLIMFICIHGSWKVLNLFFRISFESDLECCFLLCEGLLNIICMWCLLSSVYFRFLRIQKVLRYVEISSLWLNVCHVEISLMYEFYLVTVIH